MSQSIADGQQVQLAYVKETDGQGITPANPTLILLRAVDRNINVTKGTITSNEVRKTRQLKDARHGMRKVDGSVGYELSLKSYDDFLEAALGGTWAQVQTSGAPTIAAAASTKTFTRGAGSFVTDGFRPGDIIATTGFTNPVNNGEFRVITVTSTVITIDGTLADEVASAGRTLNLSGKRLDVGNTLTTFTVERQFLDVALYELFTGVSVNGFDLKMQPEQMVSGTFNLVGIDGEIPGDTSVSGTVPTIPSTYDPMTSFEGDLYEGAAKLATVTGLDFTTTNGRTTTGVVGSPITPEIFEGSFRLTGNVSAFFKNASLITKFRSEQDSKLWFKIADPDGNGYYNFVIPVVKYTGNTKNPPAEGGVVQAMPFMALEDAANGGPAFSIQRSYP